MTDLAASTSRPVDHKSTATKTLLKRRYRAEARFRAYGMLAIGAAALFLVLLLSDIVVKALPALSINTVDVTVTATAEQLGVTAPVTEDQLLQANYLAAVRAALGEKFPGAVADRASRRSFYALLSSSADMDLRKAIAADPSLIGKPVPVQALLSSDADLYFKGMVTKVQSVSGRGGAGVNGTTGEVTLFSSSNDFAGALSALKAELTGDAADLRRQAEHMTTLKTSLEGDLLAARQRLAAAGGNAQPQAAEVDKLTQDVASATAQVQQRLDAATAIEARVDATGNIEQLPDSLPSLIVEINGGMIKATSLAGDRISGTVLVPLASADNAAPGSWKMVTYETPEASRKLNDLSVSQLRLMEEAGLVRSHPNLLFLVNGDSREAELAGILGALVGTAYTMLVTLVICLPIGVLAAIYLEEFAPKNRITELVEVNINNLAAVPSIVFGLLGLAVFLNFFGLPRSSPLVGGLVLALLVLPTIIIASRAAIKAVPPSIREAALGVGASNQQAVFHHVLPLAMPGIMTGTIIGMAHALGETAPLLLIGMIAFIVDVPGGVTSAATALPVQVFLWSDLPEIGFQSKTSAAICVLLLFLFLMNGLAILLRQRFERRW